MSHSEPQLETAFEISLEGQISHLGNLSDLKREGRPTGTNPIPKDLFDNTAKPAPACGAT